MEYDKEIKLDGLKVSLKIWIPNSEEIDFYRLLTCDHDFGKSQYGDWKPNHNHEYWLEINDSIKREDGLFPIERYHNGKVIPTFDRLRINYSRTSQLDPLETSNKFNQVSDLNGLVGFLEDFLGKPLTTVEERTRHLRELKKDKLYEKVYETAYK